MNVSDKFEAWRPAAKPILNASDTVMAGYVALHTQEAKYTAIALQKMRGEVEVWCRMLSLYNQALRQEHEAPWPEGDVRFTAWHLRIRLASVAAGTSKVVLDAGLAGYYVQAFALIRHLLETWRQLAYIGIRPEDAHRWLPGEGGTPAVERKVGTMVAALHRHAKDTGDLELASNLRQVNSMVSVLRKAAHPSGLALFQTETGVAAHTQLGANFHRSTCAWLMSWGTLATAMLLHEIEKDTAVDEAWKTEFHEVSVARAALHKQLDNDDVHDETAEGR
jgi:hypothetical protein